MKNLERLYQKSLDQIMVDDGYIDENTVYECMDKISNRVTLEEILVQDVIIQDEKFAEIISQRLHLPVMSLDNIELDQELLDRFDPKKMFYYRFIPLDLYENVLSVGIASVPSPDLVEDLKSEYGNDIFFFVCRLGQLNSKLQGYAPEEGEEEFQEEESSEDVGMDTLTLFDIGDQSVKEELQQTQSDGMTASDQQDIGNATSLFDEPDATNFFSEVENSSIGLSSGGAPQNSMLDQLKAQLQDNPCDYDAINQFVETAIGMNQTGLAVEQLALFANNLESMGKSDEAYNCFEYILELDPTNEIALSKMAK